MEEIIECNNLYKFRVFKYLMKDKSYVVISGATRERIGEMMFGGLIAEPYTYRTGDLGLIHPSIVGFWKNFNKNFYGKGGSCIPYLGGSFYTHEKDDIPVLLYRGNLSDGGSYFNEFHRDYFIVPLKENEFRILRGEILGEVREEIKNLHKQMSFSVHATQERIEREIQEQWKRLTLFHPGNPKIYEIPIESTRRNISLEEIKRQEQLGKTLRELEEWRGKSLDSKFIFDRAVIV